MVRRSSCKIKKKKTSPEAITTLPEIPKENMARLQQVDSIIGRLLHYWKTNHPPTLRNLMRGKKGSCKLRRDWKQIEEKDGLLYRKITENGHVVRQLLLPESLKEKVLDEVHDKAGHPGSEKKPFSWHAHDVSGHRR